MSADLYRKFKAMTVEQKRTTALGLLRLMLDSAEHDLSAALDVLERWDRWFLEAAAVLAAAREVPMLDAQQQVGEYHAEAFERLGALLRDLPPAPVEAGRSCLVENGRSGWE